VFKLHDTFSVYGRSEKSNRFFCPTQSSFLNQNLSKSWESIFKIERENTFTTMISVCIIEDNQTYINALVTYLQKAPDIRVLFTGHSLSDLPQLIKAAPNVVIMDINLGKDSGIEGVHRLKEAMPSVQIMILTVFEEEEKIFNSLKAGAIGYLLKKDPPEKILEAIRSVHRGEGVMNGTIARKILGYFQQPLKSMPNLDEYHLTAREKEILLLLMDGLSYKEIATRCFVSIDTINSHIRKIYSKLNVRSRAEISARFRKK
jgi:DNA-binding NarL/FixJ family response regulator